MANRIVPTIWTKCTAPQHRRTVRINSPVEGNAYLNTEFATVTSIVNKEKTNKTAVRFLLCQKRRKSNERSQVWKVAVIGLLRRPDTSMLTHRQRPRPEIVPTSSKPNPMVICCCLSSSSTVLKSQLR